MGVTFISLLQKGNLRHVYLPPIMLLLYEELLIKH